MRLDHIAIAAENTAVMVEFYKKALGLAILLESPPRPSGQKAYFLGLPHAAGEGLSKGMMLEVYPKADFPRHARKSGEPGFDHIAFSAPDFDAAVAHIKANGIAILSIAEAFGGGRLVSVLDPEGNVLQIVERQ